KFRRRRSRNCAVQEKAAAELRDRRRTCHGDAAPEERLWPDHLRSSPEAPLAGESGRTTPCDTSRESCCGRFHASMQQCVVSRVHFYGKDSEARWHTIRRTTRPPELPRVARAEVEDREPSPRFPSARKPRHSAAPAVPSSIDSTMMSCPTSAPVIHLSA